MEKEKEEPVDWDFDQCSEVTPVSTCSEQLAMPSPAAAAVDSTSVSNDVDKTGFMPIRGPSLFMDPETGRLMNSEGERVDKLGRLTRARGAKGKFSSRGKRQPNLDRPAPRV